ncbi:MAG: tetratricopeptide repeat protein [Bacteroidota bacterium]
MSEELYNQTKELMKKHQWESVLDVLDDRTLEQRQDWRLQWNAGWSQFKLKRFLEAGVNFQKAYRLAATTEDKSLCLTFMGLTEMEVSRYEEAKEILVEALQLNDSTLARKSLATAYMNMEKWDEAEKVHTDGLALEPDDKERLAAYGNFLLDTGRDEEAEEIRKRLS